MKVKICGIKNREDIHILNEFLPDYCGFVFAESKRQVTPETAKSLCKELDSRIESVGVFVNETIEKVIETAQLCGLYALQLHGDEDRAYIKTLKTECPQCKIIKAIPTRNKKAMKIMLAGDADYFLFDAYVKDQRGGTGTTADWALIQEFTEEKELPFFLAGGIGVHNIAETAQLNPYAVDLSGSIEKEGGGKSREKVAEFFKRLEMIK